MTDTILAVAATTTSGTMDRAIVDAVNQAVSMASARGWEAVVLIIVILGLISLTGVIVRWLVKSMDKRMEESRDRETRMAVQINDLETFVRDTLLKTINETATMAARVLDAMQDGKEVMRELAGMMHTRPCLLETEAPDGLVEKIATHVAVKVRAPDKRGLPGR